MYPLQKNTKEYKQASTALQNLHAKRMPKRFWKLAPMKFWAYRFGTVLGERCRRGAIWDFEHKLMKNSGELEILGNGKQSKDYLYVKDCINGILTGYEKSSARVNIFNLGLQEQTTVDELADIVIEEMGSSTVRKKYTGGERGWIGDNPVVYLSIEKMKHLGWAPKMPPQEAIRLTARWTRNELTGTKSKLLGHEKNVEGCSYRGSGFLGSHIVKQQLSKKNDVVIIDNFSSGFRENLSDLGTNQECVVGNLRDYEFAKKAIAGADTVFHFAAEVGSVQYLHGSAARELADFAG